MTDSSEALTHQISSEGAFVAWPDFWSEDPVPLPSGSISVSVPADDRRDAFTVRRWLDSASLTSLQTWPCDLSHGLWVTWRVINPGVVEITAGVDEYGDSRLLAVARVRGGASVSWRREPNADDRIGVVGRELVRVLATAMMDAPSVVSGSDYGSVIPAPVAHLGAQAPAMTWHIAADGVMWRIFETDPINSADGETLRARVAVVIDPTHPLVPNGIVSWTDSDIRWWPPHTSPLLDEPTPELPEVVRKFAELVLRK